MHTQPYFMLQGAPVEWWALILHGPARSRSLQCRHWICLLMYCWKFWFTSEDCFNLIWYVHPCYSSESRCVCKVFEPLVFVDDFVGSNFWHLCRDYNCDSTTTRLQYNYDPTMTYRARLLPIRRKQKMNLSFSCHSHIIVISQSNLMHIIILITSVVVVCVVVLSYRSRIVVESQLWYRLNTKLSFWRSCVLFSYETLQWTLVGVMPQSGALPTNYPEPDNCRCLTFRWLSMNGNSGKTRQSKKLTL